MGDELPLGWEESYDHIIGRYYINHVSRKLLREIRSSYTFADIFIYVYHRVDTIRGSAARMEKYTRAHASRVPDVGTGGVSGKTRNLRRETSAAHASPEQIQSIECVGSQSK